jgi:RNA recognition motif-containing protein
MLVRTVANVMDGQSYSCDRILYHANIPRGYGLSHYCVVFLFSSSFLDITKLYIGNISFDTTTESLTELFSQYGAVTNVYVPMDRYSGEPRGFAFLALPNDAAEKAIAECDGMELDGRSIDVKVSLPRGTKAPNRKSESS